MTPDDEARAARAAGRRETWTGSIAPSHEEMEAIDLEFWLSPYAKSREPNSAGLGLRDEKGDFEPCRGD